ERATGPSASLPLAGQGKRIDKRSKAHRENARPLVPRSPRRARLARRPKRPRPPLTRTANVLESPSAGRPTARRLSSIAARPRPNSLPPAAPIRLRYLQEQRGYDKLAWRSARAMSATSATLRQASPGTL